MIIAPSADCPRASVSESPFRYFARAVAGMRAWQIASDSGRRRRLRNAVEATPTLITTLTAMFWFTPIASCAPSGRTRANAGPDANVNEVQCGCS